MNPSQARGCPGASRYDSLLVGEASSQRSIPRIATRVARTASFLLDVGPLTIGGCPTRTNFLETSPTVAARRRACDASAEHSAVRDDRYRVSIRFVRAPSRRSLRTARPRSRLRTATCSTAASQSGPRGLAPSRRNRASLSWMRSLVTSSSTTLARLAIVDSASPSSSRPSAGASYGTKSSQRDVRDGGCG